MNKQPIERRVIDPSGTLDVHSIFYTIQGEGPFAGTPCVFVRLGGCNLQCPGCDTIYTDQPGSKYQRKLYTAQELLKAVYKQFEQHLDTLNKNYRNSGGLIVITGGEPFRQNVGPFISHAVEADYYVQVESNGTLPGPSGVWNKRIEDREGAYLVTSPKTSKLSKMHEDWSCAFKYVMSHDSIDPYDGLPILALDHNGGGKVARPPNWFEGPVYLQPMDHSSYGIHDGLSELEANRQTIAAVLQSCLKYGYTLQLQIHKYIGVE